MPFKKVATGVEIKLDDGSVIKGFEDAAIFLEGEGTNDRDWKGKMGIPKVVWNDLSVKDKLTVGTEYDADLFADGETRNEKLRILSLPENVEGTCAYVDCCGPDHR